MGLFNSGLGRRLMLQLLLGRRNRSGLGRNADAQNSDLPNLLGQFGSQNLGGQNPDLSNLLGNFGGQTLGGPNPDVSNLLGQFGGQQNSEFAPRQGGMPDFSGLPDTAGLLNSRPNTFPRGVPRKGQLFGQEPQPVQPGRDPGLFRERLSF